MRILVIADDLSGAAELTGIGARHGLAARLERDAPLSVPHDGVTVLDTDTRLIERDEAPERILRAIRHIRGECFDLVYKKTDSALRGPILAEIETLLESFGRRGAIFVPQNPSRGRTIRDGVYRIDGAPLHETSFAQDPDHPARTATAVDLLGKSSHRPTRCVPVSDEFPADGVNIGETASSDDVRRWAERATATVDALPAGGADFFTALLAARGLTPAKSFLTALPAGRTLFVCGTSPAFSGAVLARAQAERIPLCPMPDHSLGTTASLESWHAAAQQALDSTTRAMVMIHRPLDPSPGAPQRFQAALAEVVGRLLAAPGAGADNLMLEGGATASAVCRRMNWHQFDVEGEFAPGVVQMRALRPDGSSEHRLVIKPGSYAWPEAIWTRAGTTA